MVVHYDKMADMQVLKYYVMHEHQKSKSGNMTLSLSAYENEHLVAFC